MNTVSFLLWLSKWTSNSRSILEQNLCELINPLFAKLVRLRWLDISLVFPPFLKAQKENSVNIQPSWPHAWSLTHIYRSRHVRVIWLVSSVAIYNGTDSKWHSQSDCSKIYSNTVWRPFKVLKPVRGCNWVPAYERISLELALGV